MTDRAKGFWRAAALGLAVLVVPACGKDGSSAAAGTPGTGVATPLYWIDQTYVTPAGATTDTPLYWNDPSIAPPGGTFRPPHTDERTYYFPTHHAPTFTSPYANDPLMTSTGSSLLLGPENTVLYGLQAARSNNAGNIGGIGGGGIGGGGGGVTIVQPLGRSVSLAKNSRANCKNFAVNTGGAIAAANPAGDTVNGGGIYTPPGRIAKCFLAVTTPVQGQVSGPAYNPTAALNYFLGANAAQITNDAFRYVGVGYWRREIVGVQDHFWTVIFAYSAPTQ